MRTHNLFVSLRFDDNETLSAINFTDNSKCPFVIKRIETQFSISYDPLLKYPAPNAGSLDEYLFIDIVSVSCPELSPKILGMCTAGFSGQVTKTTTTVSGVSLADNTLRFTLSDDIFETNPTMQRAGVLMLVVTFFDE
jgi:hypothetical protein